MVSNLKREELAKMIMELSKTSWFEAIRHDDDEKALILVDEIVKAGWVPIEDFPDEEFPVPTQAVVNDVMERIISGLPERVLKPANPEGTAVYKKQRIDMVFPDGEPIPNVEEEWRRIPGFQDYEISSLRSIRNRWTKRRLDIDVQAGVQYVDMHDKDGFEHMVSVDYVYSELFDK